MKCALLGRISAIDSYPDKTTGELIGSLSVASGKNMIQVRCPAFSEFIEDDLVVVTGESVSSPKGFFVTEAKVRHADDFDTKYFRGIEPCILTRIPGTVNILVPDDNAIEARDRDENIDEFSLDSPSVKKATSKNAKVALNA